MYYVSEIKQDLEDYNTLVSQGENYDGVKTVRWEKIIKHYNQELYAIRINENYISDLQTIENLDGWSIPNEII